MVRHILLMTLRQDATAQELAALSAGFDSLARDIPEIAALQHGAALKLPGSSALGADYAVILDAADEAAFARYIAHPLHQEFVRGVIAPLRTGAMSAQIRL